MFLLFVAAYVDYKLAICSYSLKMYEFFILPLFAWSYESIAAKKYSFMHLGRTRL